MIYKILTPEFLYRDDRGSLAQLVSCGYSQVNIVVSHAGVARGGHFHRFCHEAFYVISGRVKVRLRKDGIRETVDFSEGDFFEIAPYTVHTMYFPVDCLLAVLYDKPVETAEGKDIIQEDT